MNFNDYQAATAATALYQDAGLRTPLALVGVGRALAAADVQATVTKLIDTDRGELTTARRQAIFAELGALLWYVARTAEEIDAPLSNIAEANLAKLYVQPAGKAHTFIGRGFRAPAALSAGSSPAETATR